VNLRRWRRDRFREQVSRIEYQGFDRFEDAEALCQSARLAAKNQGMLAGKAGQMEEAGN
jgi:hypothetical protein